MGQLTLEQAAQAYYDQPSVHSLQTIDAFKAGAEWQKEQSKELINLMHQLVFAFDIRYPNAAQLLVGYTNTQAFEKMESLIKQLKD